MAPKAKETEEVVRYIRNARGGIHSVTPEHYESLLEEDGTLPKNWRKLTEAEAKKENPALFGLDEHGNPVASEPSQPVSADELAAALIRATQQQPAAQ